MAGGAVAETIPLPRPRPPEIGGPPAAAPEDEADQIAEKKKPDEPPPLSACFTRLRELAAVKQMPNINQQGGCGATDVVQLEAVILPDDSRVAVEPAPVFRCEMAAAFTDWIREELAPAVAAKLGSPLRAVENVRFFLLPRTQPRRSAPKLSEHGKANALDIRSFKLVDGTSAQPTDPNISKDFRDDMRKGACERFKTVLGPGSDGYHEDHIHLDLAERRKRLSALPVGCTATDLPRAAVAAYRQRKPALIACHAGKPAGLRAGRRRKSGRKIAKQILAQALTRRACEPTMRGHFSKGFFPCSAISPPATSKPSSIPIPISLRCATSARW